MVYQSFADRAHIESGWVRMEAVLGIRLEQNGLCAGGLVDSGPGLLISAKFFSQDCQGVQITEATAAAKNDSYGVLALHLYPGHARLLWEHLLGGPNEWQLPHMGRYLCR